MTEGSPARPPAASRTRVPRRPKRARRVSWSQRREDRFLLALTETANVAKSAAAAGLSESSVYRHRQQSELFRARWMEALNEGVVRLETMLLERALNGVERPVWHGGRQVGVMHEYSDRLALALLAAHRKATPAPSPADEFLADDDTVRTELLRRFGEMNRRMGGDG
jgi:hypothetical protein